MNFDFRLVFLVVFVVSVSCGIALCTKEKKYKKIVLRPSSAKDVMQLFPKSPSEIEMLTSLYIKDAQKKIADIIAIPDDQRTFANTAKALDELAGISDFIIFIHAVDVIEKTHPNDAMRKAAQDALLAINSVVVDAITNNRDLYNALKSYMRGAGLKEQLSPDQRYFLKKAMDDFERAGLSLPDNELGEIKKLKKELVEIELNFGANIAKDNRTITVSREGLQGLDESFIESLKRTEKGDYILGIDYPTYHNVMENCSVEATRKALYRAFMNRAYPQNEPVLKELIAKRDQWAKKLGYQNFAEFNVSDQMAGNVATIEKFLNELLPMVQEKDTQEFNQLISDLPTDVKLTSDRKMQPWDFPYVQNYYKKKHFNVDDVAIAEYFPMEKTVKGLLEIYEKFFSLRFKNVTVVGAWHGDVNLIEVYDAESSALLGYLLLDLYPRDNKFSHACHIEIIPATYKDGVSVPGISLVIANFPKSTSSKPSLLKRSDVETFFHEFGHALHGLLGKTQLASLAGTNTKMDFVEMPSQMLEEWLWDKDILKQLSSHYKTGEQLPDALIDSMVALKKFDTGSQLLKQLIYATLSLEYFKDGEHKDAYEIFKGLHTKNQHHIVFDPDNHKYAAFGHLPDYGARYYGYMWSRVFALDLFEEIKKHGLLNPVIGKKYILDILSKGGTEDPNVMLKNFLGREPNQDAFLRDVGLKD